MYTKVQYSKYYECLKTVDGRSVTLSDEHLLCMHLFYNHKLRHIGAFNDGYRFTVLQVSNPRNMDLKEQVYGYNACNALTTIILLAYFWYCELVNLAKMHYYFVVIFPSFLF